MGFPARKSAKPYDRPARKVESTPFSTEKIEEYDSNEENELFSSSSYYTTSSNGTDEEEDKDKMSFELSDLYRVCVIADFTPAELHEAVAQLKEKFDVIFDDSGELQDDFPDLEADEDEDASTKPTLVWSKLHQKFINRNNIRWVPVVISYEDEFIAELHVDNKFAGLMDDVEEAISKIYGKKWRVLYSDDPQDSDFMISVRSLDGFPFHKSICHVHAE